MACDSVTLLHEGKLAGLVVQGEHVHVAAAARLDGLAGAAREHEQVNAVLALEDRLQDVPEADVVHARGGCELEAAAVRGARW